MNVKRMVFVTQKVRIDRIRAPKNVSVMLQHLIIDTFNACGYVSVTFTHVENVIIIIVGWHTFETIRDKV